VDDNRKHFLNKVGHEIAEALKDFFGKVQFNIQDGKYVNANVEESIKPENKQ